MIAFRSSAVSAVSIKLGSGLVPRPIICVYRHRLFVGRAITITSIVGRSKPSVAIPTLHRYWISPDAKRFRILFLTSLSVVPQTNSALSGLLRLRISASRSACATEAVKISVFLFCVNSKIGLAKPCKFCSYSRTSSKSFPFKSPAVVRHFEKSRS